MKVQVGESTRLHIVSGTKVMSRVFTLGYIIGRVLSKSVVQYHVLSCVHHLFALFLLVRTCMHLLCM